MSGILISEDSLCKTLTEKPLVVILTGPPGSGKGTHATPLSLELKIPHISSGDLFRDNIRNQTPLGVQVKSYLDKGTLVPDQPVIDMLFSRISRPDCKRGYILDGFPRTITQAKALDIHLNSKARVVVLNFELDDQTIIERIIGRIACKDCGSPYHKKFHPPQKELVCDLCSGPLIQRKDDCEEIVRRRLEVYRSETQPLLCYYANQNGIMHKINSKMVKSQVFNNSVEAIQLPIGIS